MIRFTTLGLLLVLTSLASAQNNDVKPFVGIVTGDRVHARSGASLNYYPVMTLDQGELVNVRSMLYKWYEITPPEGVHALISKQYVKADPGGAGQTVGTVTADRVNVRAPSPTGPDESYKIQTALNTGDEVKIVGEDGDWYRIAPPAAASLWVHSDYIRPATRAEINAAADEEDESEPAATTQTQVTPPAETQPQTPNRTTQTTNRPTQTAQVTQRPDPQAVTTTQVTGAAEAEPEEAEDAVAGVGEDVTAMGEAMEGEVGAVEVAVDIEQAADDLEQAVDSEMTEMATDTRDPATAAEAGTEATAPDAETADTEAAAETTAEADPSRAFERPLAALEQRFAQISARPLAEQDNLAGLLADYRDLAGREGLSDEQQVVINTRVELLQGRLQLQQAMAQLEQQKQQLEERRAQRPISYDAVGTLMASSLYNGQRLPLLYRMVDPMSGLTVGYVEPASTLRLVDVLGKTVGVVGETRYDPTLRLKIIRPKQVVVLSGDEQ